MKKALVHIDDEFAKSRARFKRETKATGIPDWARKIQLQRPKHFLYQYLLDEDFQDFLYRAVMAIEKDDKLIKDEYPLPNGKVVITSRWWRNLFKRKLSHCIRIYFQIED